MASNAERRRRYYQAHREEILAKAKARPQLWYMKNREALLERLTMKRNPGHRYGTARQNAKAPLGQQWCPACQQFKDQSLFLKGRNHRCKPCRKHLSWISHLKRRYGISGEQYLHLLTVQEGRCAICRCYPKTRQLGVDHDHQTGQIRGLLCKRCNHDLLGSARDDPAILQRALDYLQAKPIALAS